MDAEEARIEGYCDSIESMKHYIVLNMRGLGSDFSDCPIESAIPPERIERIVTLPSHTAVYGD